MNNEFIKKVPRAIIMGKARQYDIDFKKIYWKLLSVLWMIDYHIDDWKRNMISKR